MFYGMKVKQRQQSVHVDVSIFSKPLSLRAVAQNAKLVWIIHKCVHRESVRVGFTSHSVVIMMDGDREDRRDVH